MAQAVVAASVVSCSSVALSNACSTSVARSTQGVLVFVCGSAGDNHIICNEPIDGKACMICLEEMPESDRWAVKHVGVNDAHFGVHRDCARSLNGRCPACREPISKLIEMPSGGTRVYTASNDAAS